MPSRHATFGFLLLVAIAALGYGLVTLPPTLIEQYTAAAKISPSVGYAYLAIVTVGATLLLGLAIYVLWTLFKNTIAKQTRAARRGKSSSELSSAEQASEIAENLAAGRGFAASVDKAALRAEIERAAKELEAKRETRRIEIVAFGTISSGKSSLLNALAGREAFQSNVVGGTTVAKSAIPWPDADQVVLVDTPGLAEVAGEGHAKVSAAAAEEADLVLFVIDGPIKAYEHELLGLLAGMEKRIVLCLNKEDWYDQPQRRELLTQIGDQASGLVCSEDVVAVASRPSVRRQVAVLPDGTEENREVVDPPDINALASRLLDIVRKEGGDLLLANLLLRSRGLVDDAKQRVLEALDEEANRVIARYMWAAGGVAATPIPLLDLAGGSAVTVKMALDLAGVYKQKIDADAIVELLAQLGKNFLVMLGASAATPALAMLVGSLIKTAPGVGTIPGSLLTGAVQALVTRWIGRVLCQYYRNEMKPPEGGLAELAKRQWEEVTRPDELRRLLQLGRTALRDADKTNAEKPLSK